MAEKEKVSGRGVVDSIYALRLNRYNTKGPGAKRARPAERPSVEQLRVKVAKVAVKKKKAKKGKNR